jgi:exosortase/archaeosortase family protein
MKIKLNKRQKGLFDTLLFLVKLMIFAIPLYLILSFEGIVYPLQEAVSQNIGFILQSLGFKVSLDGFLIKANDIVFLISEDCTGWKSMLFLTAVIFAVPRVSMKKRLVGLVIGIPLIYIGNLARILLVVFAWQGYGLEFANIIHDYFWQAGLISLVLIIWVSWLVWAGKTKTTLLKRLHKLIKPKVSK